MPWTVRILNRIVVAELEALPADMRAKFIRVVELIEGHGLDKTPPREIRLARQRAKEIEK